MKKVFLTLMVCAGLAACTSDDVVIGTTSDSAFNGGDLYMQVFISDVKDGGTRATGTDTEGSNTYTNGSEDEYAVNDAKFYFYDKDGVFISRASVWAAGNVNGTAGTSVEYTSGTMIVLKGLTSTQLPKYMVTILNEPSDFEDSNYDPANTLGELEQKLVSGITTPSGSTDYFIMSTSSYTDTTYDASGLVATSRSANNKHYFVTEISESNFLEEPVTSNIEDAVQVYVERLAAKVEVDVDSSLSSTATTDGYYELDITVGGTANDYNESTSSSSAVSDGVDQVFVKFLGWKLNATARQSYIMKNVDDEWNDESYWASNSTWNVDTKAWNDSTRYRSYWGKGTAYGTGSFPTTNINSTTGESNTDDDETSASSWLNDYLQYTSLKENLINISTGSTEETDIYGYCAENTNVIATDDGATNGIKDAYSSGITSVLLKAQAYSYDSETQMYSPLALVNYGGFYWTVAGFKDEVAREEVNYDIKHVETLATEAGLEEALAVVLKQLVGYMDPELYCATKEIDSQSWDATSDEIKTFDGSFLGLVDLGNGGVGIWPKDSGTNHTDDSSAEITSKYSPVYDTGTTTEKYPATDDLDKYYLYLKITDYSSWSTSISGTLLSSSAVKDADGNYYFYLDETNKLGNYTYRQFFVKALEMEAEETNDYFAGIIDADGSSVTTTSSTAAPNLYYDGQMYYSIPIEHLVSATSSESSSGETIVEGQYGVVRNHWYTISITGLSKLGKGISNESAVIVPDPEGVDTWLLPAQVNINAWMKVGDQKVSL